MADFTIIADTLVQSIAGIVYPQGTAAPSLIGTQVSVYQGWPDPAQLQADLAANKVHVTVWPRPNDRVSIPVQSPVETASSNGTTGSTVQVARWQLRQFQITIWANSYSLRDPLAAAIDAALAQLVRLAVPNDVPATLFYVSSMQDDGVQERGIYRRDLFYSVNYATTQTNNNVAVIKTVAAPVREVIDPSVIPPVNLGPQQTNTETGTSPDAVIASLITHQP